MTTVLRALLEHVVDYAGVFPPASLDVPTAAKNYAAYRSSPDSWMLGRFVVGVARLPELRGTIRSMKTGGTPWPLSVVAPDAAAATSVLRGPEDPTSVIESVELKAQNVAEVALVGRAADRKREIYVETQVDGSMEAMLDAMVTAKLRAKLRTGGVAADAFPPPSSVVRFIRACLDRNIPFKATAGLHHPLRGSYRLTYAAGAPSGEMYGFLNVFLAAAFMRSGMTDAIAIEFLGESDASAITIEEQAIRWREHVADLETVRTTRQRAAVSFGSCSFREPVDELPFSLTASAE